MIKFGKGVVRSRILILILAFALLIPAGISFINTRINFDILSYLPGQIETMKGQDIMVDEFGTGALSFVVIEDMDDQDIKVLADDIEDLEGVKDVIWYGTIADSSLPREALPDDLYDFFNNADADSQLMLVTFKDTMGSDETMEAIDKMNGMVKDHCFVAGMGAVNTDTKNLTLQQAPIYVLIAAILSMIIMGITMESIVVPMLFLLSIGMAIIYNLGTNFIQGEISYLTLALTAVLQLAVTMDYSIFLWHSYQEQIERYDGDKKRAMAHAISHTIVSVTGSSVTTVAGFIALCFMSFTLGLDLGIVMAKGVIIGVIGCVTILPALILACDKAIEKTKHRVLMPDISKISGWVTKHFRLIAVLFVIILIPALYGYTHTNVYYDLAGTMPDSAYSKQANDRLNEQYAMGATHIVIAPSSMSKADSISMINEIKKVDGVKMAASLDSIIGPTIPEEMLPDKVKDIFENGDYQMMLISSEYQTASDEVNDQITELNKIVKSYSNDAMLIGEAPCTKDLINITDTDFKRVSAISIIAIFVIILLVFKSISLPIILVAVIEFAIFVNMGIPGFTGTKLPFIASIVIGTIQLGATVDYAILMTTKYRKNRYTGMEKQPAITKALHDSTMSIIVSALCFFAATFGVGLYSNIDMISSICILLARGAIISMFVVILVLPSMFMIFDRVICATSMGFKNKNSN
ncbi:MAG: efflux RND transporter permease subunit [Agathobacter sp.]|jgi:predicted RND superfamily exporter protein|uniref:efflux RND transporter permease subunit n=1 Tax=Agathobacter sp. TaxID=2021311 RepID=UPI003992479E